MKQDWYKECVALFKALSDETRLRIVEMLCEGELCGCRILKAFSISQPTLSYHMKILTDCSLLLSRRDGVLVQYRVNPEKIAMIENYCQGLSSIYRNSHDIEKRASK